MTGRPPADAAQERRDRFEALVALVGEPLRRYAVRRIDPDTAQDVLADAFLVMWRRLEEVPAGAELPWCYAVTRLCLANATRSARRQRGLVARIAALDPPPQPAIDDGPDPDLVRALRTLPAAEQEVLRLWAWEDLAPREIAVVLGTSANAVSIRLHRARRRLAAALDGARQDRPGPGHRTVDTERPGEGSVP